MVFVYDDVALESNEIEVAKSFMSEDGSDHIQVQNATLVQVDVQPQSHGEVEVYLHFQGTVDLEFSIEVRGFVALVREGYINI